ncbi:LysE family translocator [Mycolicibacterium brumae]|uniref:LysE family translocator n=1 Tax=Mycolicibacterium brumae TaxID=85968 RepID=A0A2G5PFD3_9MYCO|nr:LysE family translocator [Mycolicibacterium brumae]MCV7191971.1 LysE family translocator [Mycolicibacterium brumae]PIB76820.1 LysE family translocator [Mycolicibacterium brumae]RWA20642.1 hypothetical protein MBRU_03000 [Mycolicibacterium brumae DSM 44177]UWW07738.1 LysE family translocator [Mycolicibacterium brumae]
MELSVLVAFAAVALALVAVPGPDWAFVLAAGARDHVVVPAVGGILIGYAFVTVIVVAGVGTLVSAAPAAMMALTLAGAAYVVYLGVGVLRSPGGFEMADDAKPATSPARQLLRGAGVSATNPKGLLIFLAILPQFTRASDAWPIAAQLAALGLVFMAACAVIYLPLGHAAHRLLGARPALTRLVTRASGVAMIAVGVGLAAEHLAAVL